MVCFVSSRNFSGSGMRAEERDSQHYRAGRAKDIDDSKVISKKIYDQML